MLLLDLFMLNFMNYILKRNERVLFRQIIVASLADVVVACCIFIGYISVKFCRLSTEITDHSIANCLLDDDWMAYRTMAFAAWKWSASNAKLHQFFTGATLKANRSYVALLIANTTDFSACMLIKR